MPSSGTQPLAEGRPASDDAEEAVGPGRSLKVDDIRVFSSASDAPRARRPTDVVLLLTAVAIVAVAIAALVVGPGFVLLYVLDQRGMLPEEVGH